jgi:hypothetical protein
MANFILQVSGHGQDQGTGTFPVAEKWQINFFVKMGEVLDYATSELIYQELAQNNLQAVNTRVVHTYFAGLQAGSTDLVVSIKGTTQQQPISLTNLLAIAVETLGIKVGTDTVTVYFNACRS